MNGQYKAIAERVRVELDLMVEAVDNETLPNDFAEFIDDFCQNSAEVGPIAYTIWKELFKEQSNEK